MEDLIQRTRQTRDFEGYIDLSCLAFEFSRVKLSSPIVDAIKSGTSEPLGWVTVLTNDEYYHPMVAVLALGAYLGGIAPFVENLTEALRKIEQYQRISELGALQPQESDGLINTLNLDHEIEQLTALGALAPSDLSGASRLSKSNVNTIVKASLNKIASDRWDQLINRVCQQLHVSRRTVSSNSLQRVVWMVWILQHLPNSKILHIKCPLDIWHMVVFAHEVMGMAVRVLDLNGELLARFGQTPERVLIRISVEESMVVVDQASTQTA